MGMQTSVSSKRIAGWLATFLILISGFAIWKITPLLNERHAIEAARQWGNLAPIPDSATEVRAVKHDAFTWSEIFISFQAPPAAIDTFIKSSPGLASVQPEILSPKHMYLRDPTSPNADRDMRHLYFHNEAARYGASWYDPTVRTKGRLYPLTPSKTLDLGEIVIDDQRHTVYIHADRG